MAPLPPPINGTEAYLAAVYDRLGEMLDRMPQSPTEHEAPAAVPETVELREPDTQPEPPTPVEEPLKALKEPAPAPSRNTRKRTTSRKGS
ncbi:hypothetical protein AB0F17_08335 [Nonomuraea sp. NPDC026600]|uniref:hypothetical protein n=1 Tax=Nonomuraea sp. NPDC026600 TaxID=3155363 RepID=UPI0033F9C9C8